MNALTNAERELHEKCPEFESVSISWSHLDRQRHLLVASFRCRRFQLMIPEVAAQILVDPLRLQTVVYRKQCAMEVHHCLKVPIIFSKVRVQRSGQFEAKVGFSLDLQSPEKPLLEVYVPVQGALSHIQKGSAIVRGPLERTNNISVYFEGNLHGSSMLATYAKRVAVAAGRAGQVYPTVARAVVEPGDLLCVGEWDGVMVTASGPQAETALLEWIDCERASLPEQLID